MGLMSIVALGVMQIQKSTSDTQVRAENSLEVFQIKQSLVQNFLNQNTCKATLQGLTNLNNTAINGDNDPSSVVPIPSQAIRTFRVDADGNPVAGTQRDLYTVGQEFRGGRVKINSFEIYKIQSTGLVDPGAQSVRHEITLRMGLIRKQSRGQDDADGSLFYTFIPVSAMVGTSVAGSVGDGLIDKCFSSEGNAVLAALKAACEATDFDNDGVPDNVFDTATLKCTPKAGQGYCLYGGAFSSDAGYPNPVTNGYACSDGFTPVLSGHFTKATERDCGKSKCYDFQQQRQLTCLKCSGGAAPPVAAGGAGAGTITFGNNCTDVVTDQQCADQGFFSVDDNGDGCNDRCVDPNDPSAYAAPVIPTTTLPGSSGSPTTSGSPGGSSSSPRDGFYSGGRGGNRDVNIQ